MIKLARGKTLPIPGLDYSSYRFQVEVEADTYEEASKQLEELELKEVSRAIPEYLACNDKLFMMKSFLNELSTNPKIGHIVTAEWDKFIKAKRTKLQ